MPLATVRAALEAHGCRGRGSSWTCPAHDDRNPSLSVQEGRDGRVLLNCHAGCSTDDVLAALGLSTADLFESKNGNRKEREVAAYDYVDERGELLFQAVRYFPKDFRQRRPDGNGGWIWDLKGVRRVLYRLPEVLDAVRDGQSIYLVEGEKDVHAVEGAGGVATCNPMGAGKWAEPYSEMLAAADVFVVADRDAEGGAHAARAAASLEGVAASVRVVEPATGKDAADHFAAGYGLEDFVEVRPDPVAPEPVAPEAFVPVRMDWEALQAGGLPRVQFIEEPCYPEQAQIWLTGPTGSMKSLDTLRRLCAWSRAGLHVAYYSQENPLAEDVRRLERFAPDWTRLDFYHHQLSPPVDLANEVHVRGVIAAAKARGQAVIAFDTLTACWSGDENDNAAIVAFDRDVLRPISRESGSSTIVIDHTGHPQPFTKREGVSAPRGASSKGQKADSVLHYKPDGNNRFTVVHAKARLGGRTAPPATFETVDTDDGGLDIVQVKAARDIEIEELAERMVEAILGAGEILTTPLRELVKGGKATQDAAMDLLRAEDPPRVVQRDEVIETDGGRQRAKVWRAGG